ncbi:type III secretion system export apparatus subunit SctT [Thalassospira sp. MA62]|nr:type III secretion system export apparatus subunit SctT [Thalassospira sp. MA62]
MAIAQLQEWGVYDLHTIAVALSFAVARFLGLFIVLPMFGKSILPGLLRNSVAAVFALAVIPLAMPAVLEVKDSPLLVIAIIAKEAFIGFVMGFLVAILFWAVEAIGFVIDNQRGATMSSTFSPLTGVTTSPLAILLNQAASVFFLISGGLLILLRAMYESYIYWPIGEFWPSFATEDAVFFLGQLDRFMYVAMIMAAPVLIAMFLSELGLAMISRFAPQLQVFFLAMPIKSAVGLFVLILYVGFLFEYLGPELRTITEQIYQLRGVME